MPWCRGGWGGFSMRGACWFLLAVAAAAVPVWGQASKKSDLDKRIDAWMKGIRERADDREQLIIWLAEQGAAARRALPLLDAVAQSDRSPDVRSRAKKAAATSRAVVAAEEKLRRESDEAAARRAEEERRINEAGRRRRGGAAGGRGEGGRGPRRRTASAGPGRRGSAARGVRSDGGREGQAPGRRGQADGRRPRSGREALADGDAAAKPTALGALAFELLGEFPAGLLVCLGVDRRVPPGAQWA